MEILAILPSRLQEGVERELAPDEQIVWMRTPEPKLLTLTSAAYCGAGIVCVTVALTIAYQISVSNGPEAWLLHGLGFFTLTPFVLIGILLMYSPVWYRRNARHCLYVITDRRAILFDNDGIHMTVRAFTPDKLQNVIRREQKNGLGDIVIDFDDWTGMDADRHRNNLGFLHIPDAKYVEELLRNLASLAHAG